VFYKARPEAMSALGSLFMASLSDAIAGVGVDA
jgi:hypothetical protein